MFRTHIATNKLKQYYLGVISKAAAWHLMRPLKRQQYWRCNHLVSCNLNNKLSIFTNKMRRSQLPCKLSEVKARDFWNMVSSYWFEIRQFLCAFPTPRSALFVTNEWACYFFFEKFLSLYKLYADCKEITFTFDGFTAALRQETSAPWM